MSERGFMYERFYTNNIILRDRSYLGKGSRLIIFWYLRYLGAIDAIVRKLKR